jgi:hypothetical protein
MSTKDRRIVEEVEKAQRAFERVARKLREENARLGLPLLTTSPSLATPPKTDVQPR